MLLHFHCDSYLKKQSQSQASAKPYSLLYVYSLHIVVYLHKMSLAAVIKLAEANSPRRHNCGDQVILEGDVTPRYIRRHLQLMIIVYLVVI